jgi:hypothetical protein
VSLSGSNSGHLKNTSVNMTETARPLLTPDECTRLPGLLQAHVSIDTTGQPAGPTFRIGKT